MNEPSISLVMPTFNRASFIGDAVTSVLEQSYNNFELIIVNDASSDNTREVIEQFNDPRIVYIQTDHNHGEYWSTNYAINEARGKYVGWVHSDDLLPKNSLELRFKTLEEHPEIDFVHGDIERIDEKGNSIEVISAVDWDHEKVFHEYLKMPDEREVRYMIHHTTILMKWKFFYTAGPFDASLPFAGDIDWLIRAVHAGNYRKIPSVLYQYRTHAGTRRVVDIQNGINKQQVLEHIIRRYKV